MMDTTPGTTDPAPRASGRGWASSTLMGLALFAVYLSNGREIGTYDTIPASLLPLTILRGEGLHLDRYDRLLAEPDGRLPAFVKRSRGHVVSRYPVAPALVALPLIAPQVAVLDRVRPGWDLGPDRGWVEATRMGKRASAALAALAAMLLHRLLRSLGLARVALPATLAAAFGSDLWSVASQAPWQHGPAALSLTAALLLLVPRDPSRFRILLAGLSAAVLVSCRAIDLLFALILTAHVARHVPRKLPLFLTFPILLGSALLSYNLLYFGTLSGGQADLEAMHPELHGFPGAWSGDFLDGALGTLISPSRGLFVYCPWVPLSLILCLAPTVSRRLLSCPVVAWNVCGLIPYYLLLSRYAVWWGGFCFGPRYWTDAAPLLAVILAYALDWSVAKSRTLSALFALTIALSVLLQAVGAYCSPSSWCLSPTNIDRDHKRLWDWSDTEVSRSLREAIRSPKRFESL
jgi:hypothetical protein